MGNRGKEFETISVEDHLSLDDKDANKARVSNDAKMAGDL
jgi:hypothetical protein